MNKDSSFLPAALCSICVLALLAAFHSPRLDDDSYSHFSVSVEVVSDANLRALVSDTWNKPVTALAYGVTGQIGLFPSRLVSAILAVITAFLVYRIAVVLFSCEDLMYPFTAIAFFLCQVSVFTQAFLTMTELLAAFFLAFGIWCYQKNKMALAFLSIGFMPLARVESVLVVAWIFPVLFLTRLKLTGWTRDGILLTVLYGALGMLPFSVWWLCGWLYTGNPSWMSADYVYLRSFDLKGLLCVNAFNALPAVLSAPLLTLFILGFIRLPTLLANRQKSASVAPIPIVLYGVVLIYFVFLTIFVVYPKGSGFGDLAISALNPRNYNTIAPVLAIFIFAGALFLFDRQNWIDKKRERLFLLGSITLAGVSIAGFFFFNQQFSFKPPVLMGMLRAIQHGGLLAGFVLVILLCVWKVKSVRAGITCVAIYCIICLPLTDPLFWYPLRCHDRKMQAQDEFGKWFKGAEHKKGAVVVQDMNGRLDRYCGLPAGLTLWTYPGLFQSTIGGLNAGTLVLVETDIWHKPRDRYPKALIGELESDCYKRIASNKTEIPIQHWERSISKLTTRNSPLGWVVYEKIR